MEPAHYDLFGINLYESKRMEKSIPKKHLEALFLSIKIKKLLENGV